jgi:hypothetical protein
VECVRYRAEKPLSEFYVRKNGQPQRRCKASTKEVNYANRKRRLATDPEYAQRY